MGSVRSTNNEQQHVNGSLPPRPACSFRGEIKQSLPPILRFTSLPNPERYHLSLNLFSLRPSLVKVGVHTIGFSDNPNYSRFCVRPGFLFVAPRHAVPGR